MSIAYCMLEGRGRADLLLAAVSDRLMERGLTACGIVQINTEVPGRPVCDMDVKVLPDGPIVRISQSLGPEAKGCRLNPEALDTAVEMARKELPSSDVLIVNKFGKHEASGKGFRDVIAEAIEAEVPILLALNPLNEEAFLEFAQGMAVQVPADEAQLVAWVEAQRGTKAA